MAEPIRMQPKGRMTQEKLVQGSLQRFKKNGKLRMDMACARNAGNAFMRQQEALLRKAG